MNRIKNNSANGKMKKNKGNLEGLVKVKRIVKISDDPIRINKFILGFI